MSDESVLTEEVVDQSAEETSLNDDNLIWDSVFGALTLDQVQSHIESLDHFVNTTDEKYKSRTLIAAKSVSELWSSICDMYNFGYTDNDPQFEKTFNRVGEYFKVLVDRDMSNAILALGWFAKQEFNKDEFSSKGSHLLAKMVQQKYLKMSILHQFKDISNNILDPNTSKIENPIIKNYIIGNHLLGKMIFDRIADQFRNPNG